MIPKIIFHLFDGKKIVDDFKFDEETFEALHIIFAEFGGFVQRIEIDFVNDIERNIPPSKDSTVTRPIMHDLLLNGIEEKPKTFREAKKDAIADALFIAKGNISKASKILRISRPVLSKMIKRYKLFNDYKVGWDAYNKDTKMNIIKEEVNKNGMSVVDAAKKYGISTKTVYKWRNY